MNEGAICRKLKVGSLNTRSICNKTCGVLELLKENSIDLCCVTETWLNMKDVAKFAEIHDHGYDLFSAPRRGRGGGVAFIFDKSRVKPVRHNVATFSSFEVLECIVKSSGQLLRFCVIYRSTQISSKEKYDETKVTKFLEEFETYLDSLLTKSGVPIICGDFNFKVNNDKDGDARKFISLYESKGFQQHVTGSTHRDGNTLDLVLTLSNVADSIPILGVAIDSVHVVSDHFLVQFELKVDLQLSDKQESETKEYRELHKIDVNQFRLDLEESPLCSSTFTSLDDAVQLYHDVLECLLDKHAPTISRKFKTNRSPWWNQSCQEARTEKRKAERHYKKNTTDPESKTCYKEKCIDAAIIIDRARNTFYDKKLSSLTGDSRGTYKVINRLLDKEYGADKLPNGKNNEDIANNLKTFFHSKVKKIYSSISEELKVNSDPVSQHISTSTTSRVDSINPEMCVFNRIDEDELLKVIHNMPNKSSSMDVIPMWLFKHCLTELKHSVHFIVNESLQSGVFPSLLKQAVIRPSLKKPGLDSDDLKNFRPISNLTFLSKIIEKCVHNQLTNYVESNGLFAAFQSGYRKQHSCETAVTKIHNDILMMVDKKTNVVLLLLDLSAAFDTINHQLLLQKLTKLYGIKNSVICWLKSYLSQRSFKVSVKNSRSSSCCLEIGVPQGSILGPLLFILYTKDLEAIVTKYGFTVHLYADDTQVYFSFDVHSDSPDMSSISACFAEVKRWMADNFLKLNDDKTEFLDIGVYESPLQSLVIDTVTLEPVTKAKNLGFVFDHRMSLDDQITATQQVCNMQLRNLGRIASKLTQELKLQLVQSCVLSAIDYCNSTYGSLSESNIQKLQKLQNSAIRFIFGLYGKKKYQCKNKQFAIEPLMKQLHFLPVRFRIKYKVALLVFKCLNNLAPTYLSSLLTLRDVNMHHLRIDNDFFLLQSPPPPQFKRTEGAFCHFGPKVWNDLPYSLRCLSEVIAFKRKLKTHYFNIAFQRST